MEDEGKDKAGTKLKTWAVTTVATSVVMFLMTDVPGLMTEYFRSLTGAPDGKRLIYALFIGLGALWFIGLAIAFRALLKARKDKNKSKTRNRSNYT